MDDIGVSTVETWVHFVCHSLVSGGFFVSSFASEHAGVAHYSLLVQGSIRLDIEQFCLFFSLYLSLGSFSLDSETEDVSVLRIDVVDDLLLLVFLLHHKLIFLWNRFMWLFEAQVLRNSRRSRLRKHTSSLPRGYSEGGINQLLFYVQFGVMAHLFRLI